MSNAVFVGYVAGFFTAWKLLPWVGELTRFLKHRRDKF